MLTISEKQKKVLESMGEGWYSSYELHCSLATLQALRNRGLVKSKGHNSPGAFSIPQVTIKWNKITNEEKC